MLDFEKVKSKERLAAERVIARQTKTVADAFRRFLRDSKSPSMVKEVETLLSRGRVEQALEIVDSHVVRLGDTIVRTMITEGEEQVTAITRDLASRGSTIGFSFNAADPRVVEAMQQNRLQFIVQFRRQQHETVRNALAEGLRLGQGPREVARTFVDSIGLTDYQRRVVENYREALLRSSSDALDRALRDRRFDSTVQRAIDGESVLSARQVNQMTARYRERMLRLRAETIARTEGMRVAYQAQQQAFSQVKERAALPDNMIEKEWIATDDDRVRDTHEELDGQRVVGLNTPFVSPSGARMLFPHDASLGAPPGELINCRCSVLRRVKGGVPGLN